MVWEKHKTDFARLNRIITNGSLPRDKRQTSPSPSNTPILPRFASSFGNGNIQLGATISTFNKVGFGNSTTTTEPGQPPSSPFLPASESDLKSIFGFDAKKGKLNGSYIAWHN